MTPFPGSLEAPSRSAASQPDCQPKPLRSAANMLSSSLRVCGRGAPVLARSLHRAARLAAGAAPLCTSLRTKFTDTKFGETINQTPPRYGALGGTLLADSYPADFSGSCTASPITRNSMPSSPFAGPLPGSTGRSPRSAMSVTYVCGAFQCPDRLLSWWRLHARMSGVDTDDEGVDTDDELHPMQRARSGRATSPSSATMGESLRA